MRLYSSKTAVKGARKKEKPPCGCRVETEIPHRDGGFLPSNIPLIFEIKFLI